MSSNAPDTKTPLSIAGVKFDQEKDRWDLMPMTVLVQVVKVMTFGARKYSDDNWQRVPNGRQRYYAAAMRHMAAWAMGEKNDPETGLNHLSHAMCNLIYLVWFDMNGVE